jgi:hypothetical protein
LLKKPTKAWRDFAPDFALKTRTSKAEGRCDPRRRPVLARQPIAARKPPITAGAAVRPVNGRLEVAVVFRSSPVRKRMSGHVALQPTAAESQTQAPPGPTFAVPGSRWLLKTTNQRGPLDFPPFRYGAPHWNPLTGD